MRDSSAELVKLLDKLTFFLTLAQIKHQMPTGEIHLLGAPLFHSMLEFIQSLPKQQEWQAVCEARALVPEPMWENMAMMGVNGLREQKILDKSLTALRAYWRANVPGGFFNKEVPSYEDDYEDSIEEGN